jgi:hypothetical protein
MLADIPEEHLALLDRVSEERSVPRADLIREAISLFLEPHPPPRPIVGIGLWKDHPEEGLAYQERLRAEWDRDG